MSVQVVGSKYPTDDKHCVDCLFLESVVMVLDVDNAGDWLDGPVTGDVLPVAQVEVDSPVG